jgi:hypothetical protein
MRTITTGLLALGFVGAMSLGTTNTTQAQGVYLSGPGVDVRVGDPYWRHHHRYYRHRYYDGPYAYSPGYRSWNGCHYGYTVQDGRCKPYRGY